MPSGSSTSRKTANGVATADGGGSTVSKAASGRSVPRSVNQHVRGDEIAAGAMNMKRAKRVSAGATGAESAESNSQEPGPKSKKRFVGVRQRPSGRWVAEIKDTTQKIRLWLGTFDSAEEGAKAYDSAARALRGANTRTNFVPAIASCEGTVAPATTSRAARLIRLRQTAAANSKLREAETKLGRGPNQSISPLVRPDLKQQSGSSSGDWDAHSQEGIIAPQQSAITAENRSIAINHSLTAAESPQNPSSPVDDCTTGASTAASSTGDGGKQLHQLQGLLPPSPPTQESFPFSSCATNRADVSLCADKEAASSADDNVVTFTSMISLHTMRTSTCLDDAESPQIQCHESNPTDDQLDHRDNPILREKESCCFSDGAVTVPDMIPWPDYVLVDGLADLSCETSTAGVYPAFDFSAEAMDRDSLEDQHYLSDDSSEFLLRLQQHSSTTHSSFQGDHQCELHPKSASSSTDHELPGPPVSPPEQSPGSAVSDADGGCQEQDQALWGSMDLAPLCMVA